MTYCVWGGGGEGETAKGPGLAPGWEHVFQAGPAVWGVRSTSKCRCRTGKCRSRSQEKHLAKGMNVSVQRQMWDREALWRQERNFARWVGQGLKGEHTRGKQPKTRHGGGRKQPEASEMLLVPCSSHAGCLRVAARDAPRQERYAGQVTGGTECGRKRLRTAQQVTGSQGRLLSRRVTQ